MNFFKPQNLPELFEIANSLPDKYYLLAGGTDINVQIKHRMIPPSADIIYINHLAELQGEIETDDTIVFRALTTFQDLLSSKLVKAHFPLLSDNLQNFASPLLQTTATIGGNIANGSPTADIMPLLLVLETELILTSKAGERTIALQDFYSGYKKNALKNGEIIKAVVIKKSAQENAKTFYQKVGARKTLTIAKVSLAALISKENSIIKEIRLAAGSLNEYARRLPLTEDFLRGQKIDQIDHTELKNIIQKEITPISDLRSDADYRLHVFYNLIEKAIS
ncbi:MAG: xanthine dehydrogenase family protein subunit M [Candidatus Cloacimonadales bacterium]